MTAKQRLPKIALVFLMAGVLFLFGSNLTWATSLQVEAYIDGRDQLIIQGNMVQWEHFDYAAVGRWNGNNYPTYLKTPDINEAWTPTWPQPVPDEIRFHADSSIFTGLSPALPAAPVTVTLTNLTNPLRGPVTIVQFPEAGNGYTLKVEFNDNIQEFAAWYSVELNITPTPLPAAIWLLGSGLLGLAGWGRFSKN